MREKYLLLPAIRDRSGILLPRYVGERFKRIARPIACLLQERGMV